MGNLSSKTASSCSPATNEKQNFKRFVDIYRYGFATVAAVVDDDKPVTLSKKDPRDKDQDTLGSCKNRSD